MCTIDITLLFWYLMQKGLRLPYLIIFTEQLILQIQEIDCRLIQYVEYINIHKM